MSLTTFEGSSETNIRSFMKPSTSTLTCEGRNPGADTFIR